MQRWLIAVTPLASLFNNANAFSDMHHFVHAGLDTGIPFCTAIISSKLLRTLPGVAPSI